MTNIGPLGTSPVDGVISAPGRLAEPGTDRESKPVEPGRNRLVDDGDRVEISEHARHLDKIKALPNVRPDRIDAARQALDNGSLDTDEALRNALEIMIAESKLF